MPMNWEGNRNIIRKSLNFRTLPGAVICLFILHFDRTGCSPTRVAVIPPWRDGGSSPSSGAVICLFLLHFDRIGCLPTGVAVIPPWRDGGSSPSSGAVICLFILHFDRTGCSPTGVAVIPPWRDGGSSIVVIFSISEFPKVSVSVIKFIYRDAAC